MKPGHRIEIITRGRLPYSSRKKIIIDGKGKCKFIFQEDQVGSREVEKKFEISEKSVGKISDAFSKYGFYSLSSHDSGFLDGDEVQMSALFGKKNHSVILTNYRLRKFNKIIKAINKRLPKKFRIRFHALILKLP